MALADIIVDGENVAVTHNSVAITEILSVQFSLFGERQEIDLTTQAASSYSLGRLGDLVSVKDIVISKLFDPAADLARSKANAALTITFKIGKETSKTATFWAQLKSASAPSLQRGDKPSIELTYAVTNLNASLAETGPALA